MKIDQHSITLTTPGRLPAQTQSAKTGSATSGQITRVANPFAALMTSRLSAAGSGEGVAVKTPAMPFTTDTTMVTADPLASRVTSSPPAKPAARTATPAAAAASTSSSTAATAPAQPGIGALIAAIMNGSFQPTYSSPGYASDQTARQLATLLGGTVVQQVPFASSNATTTEVTANFIQLPSGQTVNAADLAYYAQCGGGGVQQLAADLTQEINQGGAITSYNDQMVSFLSGTGSYPGAGPIFQANEIGPAIAGMTYPPGTLAADGSVINPNAANAVGT